MMVWSNPGSLSNMTPATPCRNSSGNLGWVTLPHVDQRRIDVVRNKHRYQNVDADRLAPIRRGRPGAIQPVTRYDVDMPFQTIMRHAGAARRRKKQRREPQPAILHTTAAAAAAAPAAPAAAIA